MKILRDFAGRLMAWLAGVRPAASPGDAESVPARMPPSTGAAEAPADVDSLVAEAMALRQNGEIGASWSCLTKALPFIPSPYPWGISLLEASLSARLGDRDRAEAASRAAARAAQGAERDIARYALGSFLAVSGRPEEARTLFAARNAVPLGNGGTVYTHLIRLLSPNEPLPDAVLPIHRVPGTSWGEAAAPDRPLMLAAGDGNYVSRFGPAYVAAATRQGLAVQLHVVNPEPALAPVLERLSRHAFITSENTALESWDEPARKAYYSCARLLVLPEVLQRQAAAVIMTDLDQLLLRDPMPVLSGHDDVSLFVMREHEFNFFSYVSATLAVFRPGAGAQRFAAAAAGLLRSSLADAPPQWHVDQVVLAATALGGRGFTQGELDRAWVHLTQDEPPSQGEACFWSITASIGTNARKEQFGTFTALLGDEAQQADQVTGQAAGGKAGPAPTG